MKTQKRHPWRALFTLIFIFVLGTASLVVGKLTNKGASYTPSLALDLQGGTQLILTPVSTGQGDREVTESDITEAINIIRQRIDASGVSESEISSLGSSNISVSIPGTPSQETLDLIRSSSQMNFRPVLAMLPAVKQSEGTPTPSSSQGAEVTSPQNSESPSPSESASASQSASPSESASPSASASPSLVTTALSEERAKELADINKDGVLSDTPSENPESNSDLKWATEQARYDLFTLDCTTARGGRTEAPADKPYAACDADGNIKYLLGPVDVSGANLADASAGMGVNQQGHTTGEWIVNLTFNDEGAKQFAEASKRLYDLSQDTEGGKSYGKPDRNHFAVVLDGQVITAPSMNAVITDGKAQISGNFTAKTASALANQLRFGSLPLNFEVQSEQQISATLGSEHLEKGLWAGLIGLLLVVLYMIWQYRGLAVISAGSLLVAGCLTYLVITVLSWAVGYRLSLAGIAGLIVSVGVTADSFIVYFERIRDEVRDGRPLSAAVDEGWDRAKRTILVSDAVNLVAAVVLYVLAVGGVQGFAFTLGVTTVVDLVVIFLFTHPMMELLIRTEFFGGGHKLSGLDPEHLGARSAITYAGRGRVVVSAQGSESAQSGADGEVMSLAERKRAARLAEQEKAEATATPEVSDKQEGEDQ